MAQKKEIASEICNLDFIQVNSDTYLTLTLNSYIRGIHNLLCRRFIDAVMSLGVYTQYIYAFYSPVLIHPCQLL